MSHHPPGLRYQPFYCEENAWWLCAEPVLGEGARHVVFLTSRGGLCPTLEQRAAPPGRLIAWDYHVVVVDSQGRVWDLDSRLPLPSPGVDWLDVSFAAAGRLPAVYAPCFRAVPGVRFRLNFASDRAHMRDAEGRYRHPPPSWPPIGVGNNLNRYLSPSASSPGRLMDLAQARRWLGFLSAHPDGSG